MIQNKECQMTQILNYIHYNYDRKIYLNELAEIGEYNTSYFSIVFKEFTGSTLTEYIKKIRIQQAKKMLLETDYSVEEICSIVGYSEKTQFYRLFKCIVGATPNQFRNNNRSCSSCGVTA